MGDLIQFKATKEQVAQIAVNAVKASEPMGMGFMKFNAEEKFDLKEFEPGNAGLSLDYVGGRMVKLHIWGKEDGTWSTRRNGNIEYQSWLQKYAEPIDLLKSVPGVEILEQ